MYCHYLGFGGDHFEFKISSNGALGNVNVLRVSGLGLVGNKGRAHIGFRNKENII